MKFSIVTCTWNSEPYLAQSIASVLAQDHPDIEYIFVDGGSTDGTLERIRALDRPYKLLENVRGGISHAMNVGIKAATGDVIAHLHGDDYYLRPDVISQVTEKFKETEAGWVIGHMVTDVNGQLIPPPRIQKHFSYSALARGVFAVPHPATFVRRAIFDEVGLFDENLRYAMDWDLWFRIARRHSPTLHEEAVAVFREHEGSTSASGVPAKLKARREELIVRRRYAHVAPFSHGIWLLRYLVRTRRLKTAIRRPNEMKAS